MSEHDKAAMTATGKTEKVKKINVSSVRIGQGTALSGIYQAIGTKANEVTRSHNHQFSRKGVDMLKVIKLAELEHATTDELIGRLLETNAIALAHPDKIGEWMKAGQDKRLKHNPTERKGVYNAVVRNVEPDGAAADKLAELGLQYKERHESFEGFVGVEDILEALAGTEASVRMRVGRQSKKEKERYVTLLHEGKEADGAREVLLGSSQKNLSPDDGDAEEIGPDTPAASPAKAMSSPVRKPFTGKPALS